MVEICMLKFKTYITESFVVPSHMPLTDGAIQGRVKERFTASLENLKMAVKEGTIRKADLETIKSDLNRACEATWDKWYSRPYFWGKINDPSVNITKEELDIYYKSKGFRDAASIVKNYTKFANQSKVIAMALQIAAEFAPFKDIMDHLKANMTTGRAPSTTVKYVNPNQIRGTCAWCLRDIAIDRSGLMAHHGYERPDTGWQTQSCPGIEYKNLEISLDGLKEHIKAIDHFKTRITHELDYLPKIVSLTIKVRTKNGNRIDQVIGKEDPRWKDAMQNQSRNLQGQINQAKVDHEYFSKKLREWQIKHNA